MQKILEGNLARFEVPDVLTFLNMGRRTGVLVMERPLQETKLFFREGTRFAISTKAHRPTTCWFNGRRRGRTERLARRAAGHRIGQISSQSVSGGRFASFSRSRSRGHRDTSVARWDLTFFDKVPPVTAVTLHRSPELIMQVRRIDDAGALGVPDLEAIRTVANTERVNSVTAPGGWRSSSHRRRRSLSESAAWLVTPTSWPRPGAPQP
jgi:hypothetical protein